MDKEKIARGVDSILESIECGDIRIDDNHDHTWYICLTGQEKNWSRDEISQAIWELEHACHIRGIELPLSSFKTVPWQPLIQEMEEMREQMREMQAEIARLKGLK